MLLRRGDDERRVQIGDSESVTSTTRGLTEVDSARHAAERAAARAGVEVVELRDVNDLKLAARLFADIWATGEDRPPVSADLMRAMSHTGNYVAGARLDGEIVGASMGFLAFEGGRVKLHSHITGISRRAQGRSIGAALKQHQRHWALAREIDTITWTFDPLVRRNAWFNLVKLGASITGYHPHFYGAMEDGLNAGDESDRCLVEWRLDSDGAVRAAQGALDDVESRALLADGAALALRADDRGQPQLDGNPAGTRLCWIPDDIVEIRLREPSVALAWRRALRSTFTDALADGLRATSMTRDGCYVLERA